MGMASSPAKKQLSIWEFEMHTYFSFRVCVCGIQKEVWDKNDIKTGTSVSKTYALINTVCSAKLPYSQCTVLPLTAAVVESEP